jgi:hypothetical protein
MSTAKPLPGLSVEEENEPAPLSQLTDKTNRTDVKRLTFDVTAEEHLAFKREAMDLNLSMQAYFLRLWKAGKGKKK